MDNPLEIIPSQIVSGVLVATSGALVGLLVVWAAWSRRHWFLRTAVVGGVLASAALIPAYEPMLVSLTQAIMVTGVLVIARQRQVRRQNCSKGELDDDRSIRPRFSLSTLLLLVAVAAVVSAIGARIPADVWAVCLPIVGIGICFGTTTLLATWAVLSQRRWGVRTIVLLAFAALVSFPQTLAMAALPNLEEVTFLFIFGGVLFDTLRLSVLNAQGDQWEYVVFWILVVWTVLLTWTMALLIAAWLILVRHLVGWARPQVLFHDGKEESNRSRGRWAVPARFAVGLLTLAILLPPAATFWRFLNPSPARHVVLPFPNAYDDLMQAGEALQTNVIRNYETAGRTALKAELSKQAPMLARAHAALELEFRWPLTYTPEDVPFSRDNKGFPQMRAIERGFAAEARLAEMEGRFDDAWRSYLDVIRLGHLVPKQGTFIHSLLGQAIFGHGVYRLAGVREHITPDEARGVIARLETLPAPWRPIEEVVARDHVWTEHSYGWRGQLLVVLDNVTGGSWYAVDIIRDSYTQHEARANLLIADLAVRIYRTEHGRLPETLSVLVPDYVTTVPDDPLGDGPLVYRVTNDGYLLYSFGPDRDNDDGRPMADHYSEGDFFVDTPIERFQSAPVQAPSAKEDASDDDADEAQDESN